MKLHSCHSANLKLYNRYFNDYVMNMHSIAIKSTTFISYPIQEIIILTENNVNSPKLTLFSHPLQVTKLANSSVFNKTLSTCSVKDFLRRTFFVSLMYTGNFVRSTLILNKRKNKRSALKFFTLRVNQLLICFLAIFDYYSFV